MKLTLLTYDIAKHWNLTELIGVAKRCGFAAVEFRTALGHAHGVELETTPEQRRAIKEQMEDAYLAIAGIGTSERFESPDEAERRTHIETTKRYIELAHDLDAGRVRVFGNDLPPGVPRGDVIRYVGDALRELGEFASDSGVDVLLEMHGQFNFWKFTRGAVEHAHHPRVGLVYNCDPRDVIAGSVSATYRYVRDHIRHVHLHELDAPDYPYDELLQLLYDDDYEGYLSAEIAASSDPERVLSYYAALYRALAAGVV
jgi:sugar phosphate isomerase/epimerase